MPFGGGGVTTFELEEFLLHNSSRLNIVEQDARGARWNVRAPGIGKGGAITSFLSYSCSTFTNADQS